jgi:hypothetical protein
MGVVAVLRVILSSQLSLTAIVGFAARMMGIFVKDTMTRVTMR